MIEFDHSKIRKIDSLKDEVQRIKKSGRKVVVCSGHFNVIHPGHLRFLNHAKQLGDFVIVAIYGSSELVESARSRYYSQDERATGVANLEMVDFVYKNKENVSELIDVVVPDIMLLGKEFEEKSGRIVRELDAAKKANTKVVYSSGDIRYDNSSFLRNPSLSDVQHQKFSQFIDICDKEQVDLLGLQQKLDDLSKLKLLVVGDTIVDQFVACDPLGLSAEAPVMVLKELESKEYIGGAAIIAQHVRSLGAKCHFISVLGDDSNSCFVKKCLEESGVDTSLILDKSRPTTFKIRYLAGKQKILRISRLKQHYVAKKIEEQLIERVLEVVDHIDGIILSDFSYGVMTPHLIETITKIANDKGIKVYADSQCSSQVGDIKRYKNITLASPTEKEARISLSDESSSIEKIAIDLLSISKFQYLAITLGAQGVVVYEDRLESEENIRKMFFPALAENPIDVAGAGDAMLTGLALSISSGLKMADAIALSSCMSAISVMRMGNIPLTIEEIKDYIQELVAFKELNNK